MDKAKQGPLFTMIGGAAMAIGAFLAWGSAFGISVSGIDAGAEGWITFFAGAVLVAVGFMANTGNTMLPKWAGWAALVVGLGVILLNFFDIMGTDAVSVGIGMWLGIAGGVVALFGLLQKA